MPGEEAQGPAYPNELRTIRTEREMTREELSYACRQLAEKKPEQHRTVSVGTLRNLELGVTRPKPSVARTIAAALKLKVDVIFTSGVDTSISNPSGRTRIPPDRPKGGRPRKEE